MEDDKEIIEQVLQGNKEAYEQIILKYQGRVLSLIHKMLGYPQEKQDIVQEIFMKAYYHLPQYKPQHKFSSWLYRITSNHCLDEIRRRKRTPYVGEMDFDVSDPATPETVYLEKEQKTILQQRMKSLERNYRVVLEMRYLQSHTYEEIGKSLGIPLSTVRTRIAHGKKKLREILQQSDKGGKE
ncbi:RNA polymerase sigma factor [Brevibacillus brevis]|uniref:RNA polymerase sigma factor n=1 Tax=Brevibacillus brevis TaxID=1393 RepID=UPI001158ABBA|nr:RNA polymerase sigma factor [Lysinibacillus sp. SDF0063]TQR35475.1 RNA polymerase sigma factor [Lysinibacillus sp. SDF0063]